MLRGLKIDVLKGLEDKDVEEGLGDRLSNIINTMQSFRTSKPQKSHTLRRSKAKSICDHIGVGQSRTKRELKNAETRLRSRRVENTSPKIQNSSKEAFYIEVEQKNHLQSCRIMPNSR